MCDNTATLVDVERTQGTVMGYEVCKRPDVAGRWPVRPLTRGRLLPRADDAHSAEGGVLAWVNGTTGQPAELLLSERLHVLARQVHPYPAPASADPADVLAWFDALVGCSPGYPRPGLLAEGDARVEQAAAWGAVLELGVRLAAVCRDAVRVPVVDRPPGWTALDCEHRLALLRVSVTRAVRAAKPHPRPPGPAGPHARPERQPAAGRPGSGPAGAGAGGPAAGAVRLAGRPGEPVVAGPEGG